MRKFGSIASHRFTAPAQNKADYVETFFMHSLAHTFTSIFCLKKLADCLIILKELHNFDRAMLSVAPCRFGLAKINGE